MNERDYELLSAYIDGVLSRSERAALEARLADEPELQQQLNSLQQTVSLLRQMPELRAPRDFTLDARQIGPRPAARPALPFPLTATFSALSTAAAILLFAFGGYFLLQTSGFLTGGLAGSSQSVVIANSGISLTAVAAAPTGTPMPTQVAQTLADQLEMAAPTASPLPTEALDMAAPPAPAVEESQSGGETAPSASFMQVPSDDHSADGEFDEGYASADSSQAFRERGATTTESPAENENAIEATQVAQGALSLEAGADQTSGGAGMSAPATAIPRAPMMLATDGAIFATMQVGALQPTVTPPELPATPTLEKVAQNVPGEARIAAQEEPATAKAAQTIAPAPAPGADPLGLALLAGGVILLGAAIVTTLVRRRRINA